MPTTSLADLVVPRRPQGVPYSEGEDFDAQALLEANGYAADTEQLIELLESPIGVFQAAAARLLGYADAGVEQLRALAVDDLLMKLLVFRRLWCWLSVAMKILICYLVCCQRRELSRLLRCKRPARWLRLNAVMDLAAC